MAKYSCIYCQNPILTCRVSCVVCPDYDLCLQCFACGAESASHKKEHDYQVLDDGGFSVFQYSVTWTASDEEALLEAVEQYGFGNWEDTANHVKTKSSEECKEHYYTYFLHGNIGRSTFTVDVGNYKVIDHTTPEGGPLSPSLTTPLPPLELSLQEQQELGYMPLRDDFEREFDNEAEILVSGLSINYDDEDIDIAFKLAQVDIYRQRLKERARRKRTARGYGVIQNASTLAAKQSKSQKDSKKKLSKEERDFQDKLRIFAQFHSLKDHEHCLEQLRKEKEIKMRIKELIRFRRNGLTKLDECADYEAEKLRREKKRENKKKLASSITPKRTSMVSKKAEEKLNEEGKLGDIIGIGDKKPNGVSRKNLESFPGVSLLSLREKRLCHSIGMKPASYITIKTCIIKDYLSRRQGQQPKIRYPSHLDKTHRRKILSFLSENGWIGSVGAYG